MQTEKQKKAHFSRRKLSEGQIKLMLEEYDGSNAKLLSSKFGICRDTFLRYKNPEYRESALINHRATHTYKNRPRPPKGLLLSAAKHRAAKYGIQFNLTIDDIVIPKVCPVLGIELTYGACVGKPQPGSLSLDRIKPELGYTKGNVRVISFRANTLKSDATIPELEMIVEDLYNLRNVPC